MTFSAGKIRQASRRLPTAILHVLPAVLLAFVLAVSGVSGALAAGVLHTEAAQAKGRDIYLVYDDSGSMVSGTVVRWSQAKYAMEVFAALMGAGDTMSIFPMSQNENGANFSFPVNGSDSNRVRTVHEMNYGYGNTPSLAVANAMNAALEASSAKERWVVVLTDGAFDDANNDGGVQGLALVQGYLDQCNAAGIKTAYLAIGDAALLANANPAAGAYAEKAEDNSVSILQKITSIANQIFQHQIVPGSRIQESGGTTKLSIDIPTDQLIVFAQGDNVNLGKVTLNGKRIDGSFQQVKYADDPSLYPKSNASVDTSLKGVVFTCDAGKEPYEDGTFEVEISGASTVEYYITAGVDVVCELSRDGQPVESGETVGAGKYEYKTKFKSRKTGQEITSDLLPTDDSRFYVRVENNGNVLVNQTGSEGSFEVEEGSCVIDTAAYLPGDVVKTSHLEMTVEPPSSVLEMTYELPDGGYSLISLAGNPQPVKIHVKDQKKGALTAQQWEALQVQTEGSGGLSWKAEKSPEIGTLLLTPVPKDPDVTKIKVKKGVVELSLKAEVDDPTLRASGEASMQIPIDENRQISLAVTLSEPSAPYDLNEFYEGKPWNGFAAKVEKIDPVTGAAIPLTQEEWDALNLKADCNKRLSLEITKGKEIGQIQILPQPILGGRLSGLLWTSHGNMTVTLAAKEEIRGLLYEGSGQTPVQVIGLTWLNLLKLLWPFLLRLAIFLFILIGEIRKPRIPRHGMNPTCYYISEEGQKLANQKRRIDKNFFTVICPYIAETAVVRCSDGRFQCNFPNLEIRAATNRSFQITNKSLPLGRMKINKKFFKSVEDVQAQKFAYSGFVIASYDDSDDMEKGKFTFYYKDNEQRRKTSRRRR